MEDSQLKSSNSKSAEIIRMLPALVIGMSSVCFILGLLIVNFYLASFGIYSYEFIRTEYILTGGVFALLVGQAAVGIYYSQLFYTSRVARYFQTKKPGRYKRIFFLIVFVAALVFIEVSSIQLISLNEFHLNTRDSWIGLVALYVTAILIMGFYNKLTRYLQVDIAQAVISLPESRSEKGLIDPLTVFGDTPFLKFTTYLVMIFATTGLYALSVYPYIQGSYGGGVKDHEILIPTARGLEVCKQLSLPINGTAVGPLEVLTESDKEIVVLVPNELSTNKIAVRINKNNFDAAQTIPLKPKTFWSH